LVARAACASARIFAGSSFFAIAFSSIAFTIVGSSSLVFLFGGMGIRITETTRTRCTGDTTSSYDSSRAYSDETRQLSQEINRLSYEVEQLRQEQEYRPSAPPPSQPPAQPRREAKPEPPRPTVLIFRDKHVQEVKNYAIVDPTLWILNERRATKVPLSSLDVDATTKLNDERGVEFSLPK
jgi:hypothetical protein